MAYTDRKLEQHAGSFLGETVAANWDLPVKSFFRAIEALNWFPSRWFRLTLELTQRIDAP